MFALNALALMRDEEPNSELIRKIIKDKGFSHLAHSWQMFMTEEEHAEFGKQGHLRSICEQIVFLSYVAIEDYLKSKFREYFHHLYSGPDTAKVNSLCSELSFRNLSEMNQHFKKYLGANISRFFHPSIALYEEAQWFRPKNCWAGLKRLEACRHEVAHEGSLKSARLVVLVDAWSVFEFVHCYGQNFETSYNAFVYQGKKVPHETAT